VGLEKNISSAMGDIRSISMQSVAFK